MNTQEDITGLRVDVGNIKFAMDSIRKTIEEQHNRMNDTDNRLDRLSTIVNQFVTQFQLVSKLVLGACGLVLVAVLTALIKLVIM